MKKKWTQWFISTSEKKGNLIEAGGAVILLLSQFLPWFEKTYIQTDHYTFGGEMLFAFLYNDQNHTLIAPTTVLYVFILSTLILLQINKKVSQLLSLGCLALIIIMLYKAPLPLEKISVGPPVAITGLLLIISGTLKNRS